jgi:protein TonB
MCAIRRAAKAAHLRAFILIALLGGAALAGGLYFGGGLNQDANAPPAIETTDNSTDAGPPPDAPADALQPDGVNLSEAIDERPVQTAAREPARRLDSPPMTRDSEGRDLNAAAAPASPAPSSGPISLSPGSTPSTSSGGPVPLGPQPLAPQTSVASNTSPLPAAQEPPPRAPAGAVVFTQRPTPRRIADLYPDAASRQNLGGRVQLNCTVQANLSLACSVVSESTPGVGFGRAALSAANAYRARATLSDGRSAVGSTTRIAVAFQAPE